MVPPQTQHRHLAVQGVDQLLAIVKNRLKRIQYHPDLLNGFLTYTGLNLSSDSS
ncbi:hypothetical protein ACH4OY_11395 [Micromonospora rubida]|uniref:Transposase n=1 Tax=Micromonospora rubida TaxID=2697657 RepID=A0ABW7SHW3_9ACTN